MNPHIFSLEEANALIPKLDQLTTVLIQKKIFMQKKHDQLLVFDLIEGEKISEANSSQYNEYSFKRAELEKLVLSFEEDILKVVALGCYLRDIGSGAIDFFSIRNSELIYLNWKRGEGVITHYHDVDTHFNDRKPLQG